MWPSCPTRLEAQILRYWFQTREVYCTLYDRVGRDEMRAPPRACKLNPHLPKSLPDTNPGKPPLFVRVPWSMAGGISSGPSAPYNFCATLLWSSVTVRQLQARQIKSLQKCFLSRQQWRRCCCRADDKRSRLGHPAALSRYLYGAAHCGSFAGGCSERMALWKPPEAHSDPTKSPSRLCHRHAGACRRLTVSWFRVPTVPPGPPNKPATWPAARLHSLLAAALVQRIPFCLGCPPVLVPELLPDFSVIGIPPRRWTAASHIFFLSLRGGGAHTISSSRNTATLCIYGYVPLCDSFARLREVSPPGYAVAIITAEPIQPKKTS